jgi:predicted transcriptional regulator of viral defense system
VDTKDMLKKMGIVPVDYAVVKSVLVGYRSPKDKVSRMEAAGDLIRLKKGLFLVSSKNTGELYSRELVANHLYGPSYVSLETALAYYGLIPERVHLVRSVTTKRTKKFSTPIGNFEYTKVGNQYFGIGINQNIVRNQYAFMMASPEKALCDMIVLTSGLRIQSVKAMREYLEEDMRVDLSEIKLWNIEIVRRAIECGKKKTELKFLLEVLSGE